MAACVFLPAESARALDLYVAADGRDTWSGRLATTGPDNKDGPFATLERARDEIRKLKRDAKGLGGAVMAPCRAGSRSTPGHHRRQPDR